jgi:hypothetical protein
MAKRYGRQRLSYSRWQRDFTPIEQEPGRSWGGYAIEDFRACWQSVCLPALDERRLWSANIYDGAWCIVPGNHPVNREAVIITRVPYPPEVEELYVRC